MDFSQYRTTKQAADDLDISARRVLQLIASHDLQAIKPGTEWYIREKSIEAYAARRPDPKGGRPRSTRTCPACGGTARTTDERKKVWGRYLWVCDDCGEGHIVYQGRVRFHHPGGGNKDENELKEKK